MRCRQLTPVLRGRRLLTACCLSDVLRIYAPDTPFSRDKLKVRWGTPANRTQERGGRGACGLPASRALSAIAPPHPRRAQIHPSGVAQVVFELFVSQLQGIRDPHGPSYSRYYYLLERLAMVKSFVLMIDLKCDDLVRSLFEVLFNSASKDHSIRVEVSARRPSTHVGHLAGLRALYIYIYITCLAAAPPAS